MSRNSSIRRGSEALLARAMWTPDSARLGELVGRNRDRDLPRLRFDEGRKREDHAIHEPGQDPESQKEAEQARHGGKLGGGATTTTFAANWQGAQDRKSGV